MSSDRVAHPVVYRDALVAVVGPDRCHILAELDAEDLRLVLTMCLYNREVQEGRVPGPFRSDAALCWARLILAFDRGRNPVGPEPP